MSFAAVLKRLTNLAENPSPGTRGSTRVELKDLRELLHHYNSYDDEARRAFWKQQADIEEGIPKLSIVKVSVVGEVLYRANIIGPGFDYHGEDLTPHHALLNAAHYWCGTEALGQQENVLTNTEIIA